MPGSSSGKALCPPVPLHSLSPAPRPPGAPSLADFLAGLGVASFRLCLVWPLGQGGGLGGDDRGPSRDTQFSAAPAAWLPAETDFLAPPGRIRLCLWTEPSGVIDIDASSCHLAGQGSWTWFSGKRDSGLFGAQFPAAGAASAPRGLACSGLMGCS